MRARAVDELDPKIDLRSIALFLKRRSLIIGLCMVIGLLLGAVHFTRTPPTFVAKADVLINSRQPRVFEDQAVVGNLPVDNSSIDTETEVIRSIALARRVVRRYDLTRDPLILPPQPVDEVELRGASGAAEAGALSQDALMEQAARILLGRTEVSRKGLTQIIEVTFESETALHAAQIANAIVDTYISAQIGQKNDATNSALTFLQSRLDDLRAEVVEAEAAVERYRARRELARAGGMTLNERQLIELNQSLARAEAERTVKEARLSELNAARSRGSLGLTLEGLEAPVMTRLRDQQAQVVRRKAEFASRYGPRHPQMIQVNQELADLERQISAEIARVRGNLQDEVKIAAATESSIRRSLQRLEQTSASNELDLVRLRDLERNAEATRLIYQAFLERSKTLTNQSDLLQADATVLSEAVPALGPAGPVLWRMLGVYLFGSLVVGVGLAVLREFSYGGVTTNDQLEKQTGLNHLASIPKLRRPNGRSASSATAVAAANYIIERPQSTFAEAFGRLQLMINAAAESGAIARADRLMFTSALAGEGKSTTAVGFARSCALSNLKTVLIDADLRRPAVHRYLGVRPRCGLTDVVNGRAALVDALHVDERTGLSFIPMASTSRNPRATLGSPHFQVLLDTLSDSFDRIIIDAPPVLPVPDAIILGKWVDAALLVAKWRHTDVSTIKDAMKELHAGNVSLLGGVLTQVDWATMRAYGGYYTYASHAQPGILRRNSNIIPWNRRRSADEPPKKAANWR
ncbi:MAG: polysaccharide biosynthesis tyrosine autokinase [Pseudomonadota bacterium]